VGMLAEAPMPGALFGETIMAVMKRQFTALRDGDRFYYMNDPVLSKEEKEWISRTTLRDIIMYNTTISLMQDNVFQAMPHEEICDHMTGSLEGAIRTPNGNPIPGVVLDLSLTDETLSFQSTFQGRYAFTSLPSCKVSGLYLAKDDDIRKGLSTLDIILMQKHILGLETLDSPYRMIAADADRNGSVSVQDIILLRRVILGLVSEFPGNTVWRFIPADLSFEDPSNALLEELPEVINFNAGLAGGVSLNYIGIKIGDVNASAKLEDALEVAQGEPRSPEPRVELAVADLQLRAGERYEIPVRLNKGRQMMALQLGLQFDREAGAMLMPDVFTLPEMNAGHFGHFPLEGRLTMSWNNRYEEAVADGTNLFNLQIRVEKDGKLSDFLQLDHTLTAPEAYNTGLQAYEIELVFESDLLADQHLQMGQNYPNPFRQTTRIPFRLAQAAVVDLRIFDGSGRTLYQAQQAFGEGTQQWDVQRNGWPAGVLYYQLNAGGQSQTRQMLVK
ncbi:MAG: T9SS type A sorting domain-containing protein, partial [Lewinella sp.]|nr:T9SS type A sorting domain-containing protein [Lewinella sp.]